MAEGQATVDYKSRLNPNPFQHQSIESVWPVDRFLELIGDIRDRIHNFKDTKNMHEIKRDIGSYLDELTSLALETRKWEQDRSEQLSRCVSFLQRSLEEAKEEELGGKLAQLADRSNFDFKLLNWVAMHEDSGEPFTIALVDLDGFRRINDSLGWSIGDQVLAFVALELGSNIRENDFLGRCGGDKFGILSSGMELGDAERRFSKLLKNMATTRLQCKISQMEITSVSFTASCGIAEYFRGESANELINRAHSALYDAKRLGRNRVATKLRFLLGKAGGCRR
jgi:diguanylate cyclase (GGDEF)-like protein